MHALRRNPGQTPAEYIGALRRVAALIGARVPADIGIAVAREVHRQICSSAGGEDCGQEAAEAVRPQVKAYADQHGDRHIHDADDGRDEPGDEDLENGDGPTGDHEADAAYDNYGRIYDNFMENFGRSS
jgi:hypothetical protein